MIMQLEKVLPGRALAESKNNQCIIAERQNWNASVSGIVCRAGSLSPQLPFATCQGGVRCEVTVT